MNSSKVAVTANAVLGKILSIVGYSYGSLMLLGIIAMLADTNSEDSIGGFLIFLMCIFLLAPPILAILKGIQIKRRLKRFKQYVVLISGQQMTSLENIAASTNKPVDFVMKDLQKMIKKKFFANATIDMVANEIFIGGRATTKSAKDQDASQEEMETYVCSGCDAAGVKPKGKSFDCEYCGSPV